MTIFSNHKALVSDSLRAAVAGIHAVRADTLVVDTLKNIEFRSVNRIFGISVGKAAAAMHAGLISKVPPEKWGGGIVVTLKPESVAKARNVIGSHPIPTERSRQATDAIFAFLRDAQLSSNDLVVCCISGGTSAMLAAPVTGLTLADLAEVNRQLLLSGLDVTEMNSVRQALSTVHGGGLARACIPARCLGLILCDVVKLGPSMVGSGPTYPPGRMDRATRIVRKCIAPPNFQNHILEFMRPHPLTPKIRNIVVGGPANALHAAACWATRHGYQTAMIGDSLQGEARNMVKKFSGPARSRKGKYCLLATGEVTVTVNGPGVGGRCQEFAWAMAREIAGMPAGFVAIGTDGCDHVPGIAGAWVDGRTMENIAANALDWHSILSSNDSYSGLFRLNQLIHSKGTGTNVCDLYVMCGNPAKKP